MRMFSNEVALLAALLGFAALLFWMLFGKGADVVAEKAHAIIIGIVVLVLLLVTLLLHFR